MNALCRRGALLIALAASTGLVASAALAGAVDPRRSAINATAKLSDGGRLVHVTGRVRCARCTRITLAVTVSQRNGALAQGGVRCVCRSATERWIVNAKVRQATTLRAGRARVCTWVIGQGAGGKAIDAYQWCRDVTLT